MSIFSGVNNPGVTLSQFSDMEVQVLEEIAGLTPPGADRILFWDDSANSYAYLTAGSGLTITGTTITASGVGSGTVTSVSVVTANGVSGSVATSTTTPAITLSTTNTSGSILFAGAAGQFQQDNANLFWDDTNNRLGIGNAAPTANLTIKDAAADFSAVFNILNSAGGTIITVRDDQKFDLGSGAENTQLSILGSGAFSGIYSPAYSSGTNNIIKYKDFNGNIRMTLDMSSTTTGKLGIGQTSPTAIVHIKAGTASANTAPLKFTSGTSLTTPEAGAVEYDGGKLWSTNGSATRESLVGAIFTQTASNTVTNTVTETSLVGTGVGYGLTLPANFFVTGKTIRLRIGGIYTTPSLATPSVTVKVKYGSTVLASVTTSSLLSGAANLEFDGEVNITCRTTGVSGTVMLHGDVEYATGIAGTIAVDPLNNAGATTTINTTTSNLLDVTITWDSATATRSVTSTVMTVEVIN